MWDWCASPASSRDPARVSLGFDGEPATFRMVIDAYASED